MQAEAILMLANFARRAVLLATVAVAVPLIAGGTATIAKGQGASPAQLAATDLKAMIVGLGYEPKDLGTTPGSEKVEVVFVKGGLNIPVGAEISPSKRLIWLTVSLGALGERVSARALLEQNAKIQPSHFFVNSKGTLLIGIPLENRAQTPANLRWALEKLTDDVVATKAAWQPGS